jgi:hypothetical protein
MTRATPSGSDSQKSIFDRSGIFDALVGDRFGSLLSACAFMASLAAEQWTKILPKEVEGFSGILHSLSHYFLVPWHAIQLPFHPSTAALQ